jgi:outer membrane protein assembly factor BamA
MLPAVLLCLSCIVPEAQPLPDSTARVVISSIQIEGNKKTQEHIITRELTFKAGDTLRRDELDQAVERSRLNILNTVHLFNFARAEKVYADSSHVTIRFTLSEAWYTWPAPIFELVDRNPNEWLRRRDLSRTQYGIYVSQYNCRGRNETLNFGFKAGYTQSLNFQYSIPYINRSQTAGLAFGGSYSRNRETNYNILYNKQLFFKADEYFTRNNLNFFLRYSYRKSLYTIHSLTLGYRDFSVADSILILNPEFLPVTGNRIRYFYLSYLLRLDKRDLRTYPLRGYLATGEILKSGLGLHEEDIDEWVGAFSFRKFWELSPRWFYAAGLIEKISLVNRQAYSNQLALGFGDYLRGYEYYVINGQHGTLLKTNFKYLLMKTRIVRLKIIPVEKFRTIPNTLYVNLFADAGHMRDRYFNTLNPLANTLLLSCGMGLDYVTYYNAVLRADYSINKFGEKGIFLHFTVPI